MMSEKLFASKVLAGAVLLVFAAGTTGFAATAKITLDYKQALGDVNRNLFGNNLLGYDPVTVKFTTQSYPGHMDFGEGIWDPTRKQPVQTVVDLAKAAGISVLRFPGGCGSHQYNWKEAIGPDRRDYLFGIDEFLKVAADVGAVPVFTLSYFTGNENDAADLVEYLNAPSDGSNPNGGTDWAAQRAANGHPEPYKVKYFEFGNEVWHGNHLGTPPQVAYFDYAQNFLKHSGAMKAVDPTVQLGMVLFTQDWNQQVLDIIKDKVDFAIIHTYPSPEVTPAVLAGMNAKDIFRITYFRPLGIDMNYYRVCRNVLREKAGRDIPLALTEYNGGFIQDSPVPYRHSLGTALLNAEMLRLFMLPQNNVMMANYWNFVNEYWGMVATPNNFMAYDYSKPITYIKRPNYFVYDLYRNHFGDVLIKSTTTSDGYKIAAEAYTPLKTVLDIFVGPEASKDPAFTGGPGTVVPYLTVNASKSFAGDKLYLMVINRNMDTKVAANIDVGTFPYGRQAFIWTLNGPAIDSTNEQKGNNVQVKATNIWISKRPFLYYFEPHSVTAIEIPQK